jgi:hypothetical protein
MVSQDGSAGNGQASAYAPGAQPAAALEPLPPRDFARFIGALFEPDDQVLVRPVEAWTEAGAKKARTIFKATFHATGAALAADRRLWQLLLHAAEEERLSCEPLLEPLKFKDLGAFQWVVLGGASASTQTPEWRPPRAWVNALQAAARAAGCRVYEKDNLLRRLREYPGVDAAEPAQAPEALRYLPGMG